MNKQICEPQEIIHLEGALSGIHCGRHSPVVYYTVKLLSRVCGGLSIRSII